jgi:hypothetical protein
MPSSLANIPEVRPWSLKSLSVLLKVDNCSLKVNKF